jgi:DNA polymerase III epsilon subunit-like protein
MTRIVFYDLETSGLDRGRHEIIQIGAVAVDRNFREMGRFERKLKFNRERASPEALNLNSFDEGLWQRDAIPQEAALRNFCDFLREHADVELISKKGKPYRVALGAGHNVRGFDQDWIRRACKSYGLFLPMAYRPLDTRELAEWWQWQAQPQGLADLKLTTLCAYLGIEIEGAHDALADAVASAGLASSLLWWRALHQSSGPFLPDHDPCEEVAVEQMREALESARSALGSLDEDCLGTGEEVVTSPDGEVGILFWSLRDELIHKITKALE